ncbi:hypothetical protein C1646_90887 [Rhizophagus diaphanus]|nr:hypothetical protein C1646_90887 [Rhizophagus diaphanus] [Rhizophagus sp. MUCL 43196]
MSNACGNFRLEDSSKKKQEQEFEHAIHSFIIDVNDELTSSHLSDTELDEIDYAAGPHVPDLPDQIAEFLYEFVGKVIIHLHVNDKDRCIETKSQNNK